MVSRSQAGQNLVRDGSRFSGNDIYGVVGADQFDHRPRAHFGFRQVTDVEGYQIHGNTSHKWYANIADVPAPAMAQRSKVSIGVSDRNRRDSRSPVGAIGGTIANRPTPVNFADLKYFSLQFNDLRHRIGVFKGW